MSLLHTIGNRIFGQIVISYAQSVIEHMLWSTATFASKGCIANPAQAKIAMDGVCARWCALVDLSKVLETLVLPLHHRSK